MDSYEQQQAVSRHVDDEDSWQTSLLLVTNTKMRPQSLQATSLPDLWTAGESAQMARPQARYNDTPDISAAALDHFFEIWDEGEVAEGVEHAEEPPSLSNCSSLVGSALSSACSSLDVSPSSMPMTSNPTKTFDELVIEGEKGIVNGSRPSFDSSMLPLTFANSIKSSFRATFPEKCTYECRFCGKFFERGRIWKRHMDSHNYQRKYSYRCMAMCGSGPCTEEFQSNADLDRHFHSVHLNESHGRCHRCGELFTQDGTFESHFVCDCPSTDVLNFSKAVFASPGVCAGESYQNNSETAVRLADYKYAPITKPLLFSNEAEFGTWDNVTRSGVLSAVNPAEEGSCSSDTDESQDLSPEAELRMILLRSKHQLMVRLMLEVYVIFDKQWSIAGNSCAGSEASGSSSPARPQQSSNGFQKPQKPTQKRGRDEQDPEDEKPGKRRRKDHPEGMRDGKWAFACPYHQKDPIKYSCNGTTGLRYRACMGPGFENISRLKQHLKRVHKAPIQCTRCWTSMESLQAMSEHANSPTRCEPRDPDPQGISQDKMDLISGKWGATWDSIFEILFPGAPILSPYYGSAAPGQSNGPPSPGSQGLSDFETYSRIELPRLIEANLQTMVDTEVAPLEENIKKLVVDVVRRCQSTVAQNYGRIKSSTDTVGTKSSQASAPTIEGGFPISNTPDDDFVQSSFEEPPFRNLPVFSPELSFTAELESMNPPQGQPSFPSLHSDSGYGTLLDEYDCRCGDSDPLSESIHGFCTACGLKRPIIWSRSF